MKPSFEFSRGFVSFVAALLMGCPVEPSPGGGPGRDVGETSQGAEDGGVEPMPCLARVDCAPGEVCDAGVCAQPPEVCVEMSDCPVGQVCVEDLGVCVIGCPSDSACGEGEICEKSSRLCVPGCRQDEDCAQGWACDESYACVEVITSCAQVTCARTQRCDPETFACEEVCGDDPAWPNACPNDQICDDVSGACVECVTSDHCGGRVCEEGACTSECAVACMPDEPGSCGEGAPYCVDGCCVACASASDCSPGQVCEAGACEQPISCAFSPRECPRDLPCQGGSCLPPPSCRLDPDACPFEFVCVEGECERAPPSCDVPWCDDERPCADGLSCDGCDCVGCSDLVDPACGTVLNLCVDGVCVR